MKVVASMVTENCDSSPPTTGKSANISRDRDFVRCGKHWGQLYAVERKTGTAFSRGAKQRVFARLNSKSIKSEHVSVLFSMLTEE